MRDDQRYRFGVLGENAVELKNLRMEGPDAFLSAPLLKGAFKERRYTFPEGVAFRWGPAQASLAVAAWNLAAAARR